MAKETLYIFVGVYCKSFDYDYLSKKYYKKNISVSNSEYERMLFNEFVKQGKQVFMLSAPNVGRWPTSCKRLFFAGSKESQSEFVCNYCTLFGFANFSKSLSLVSNFRKIVEKNKDKRIVVIACEAHKPYLNVLKIAKKKYGLETSLIVPDLPEDMIYSDSVIYKYLKKRNVKDIYLLADKYVDSFYFFTDTIRDKFLMGKVKPFVVHKGLIEDISYQKTNHKRPQCLYAGKTDERNGVALIVEAAKSLPDFDFNIYGSGNLDDSLKNIKGKNVKYHGFISPVQIEQLLLDSDILLSPRLPASFTSNSFPSKIMKYLSCSKPIVTFYLDCYGEDFDSVLFFPNTCDSSGLITTINKAKDFINKKYTESQLEHLSKHLVGNVVADYINMLDNCSNQD